MPHTKRTPVPSALTVRLGTPVERDFWTHYFKASLADVELAMAEVGNNDREIARAARRGADDSRLGVEFAAGGEPGSAQVVDQFARVALLHGLARRRLARGVAGRA